MGNNTAPNTSEARASIRAEAHGENLLQVHAARPEAQEQIVVESATIQEVRRERHVDRDLRQNESSYRGNSLGLGGLVRCTIGCKKYSGAWDESLGATLNFFEAMSTTCNLSDYEMARGLAFVLDGDALQYYTRNFTREGSYKRIVDGLKAWYTSEEQRSRLLQVWQRASLKSYMELTPMGSEMSAFRKLLSFLQETQAQLHEDYHPDRFLRDQLVMAADVPHVARALREKVPHTSHEAIQRIASLLSDRPKSAGANFSGAADELDGDVEISLYGLGKKYHGQARKFTSQRDNNKKCWV
jgi:hypothetical protein